jgi:hypothetical protein
MENQPNETAAQVKAALPITGDDVRRFIVELREKLGPKAEVHCYTSKHSPEGNWIINASGESGDQSSGRNLESVITAARAKALTPAALAKKKRDDALRLMAEADAIDGETFDSGTKAAIANFKEEAAK